MPLRSRLRHVGQEYLRVRRGSQLAPRQPQHRDLRPRARRVRRPRSRRRVLHQRVQGRPEHGLSRRHANLRRRKPLHSGHRRRRLQVRLHRGRRHKLQRRQGLHLLGQVRVERRERCVRGYPVLVLRQQRLHHRLVRRGKRLVRQHRQHPHVRRRQCLYDGRRVREQGVLRHGDQLQRRRQVLRRLVCREHGRLQQCGDQLR